MDVQRSDSVTKKKKRKFFESYISSVQSQLGCGNSITKNAKHQLNSILCSLTEIISNQTRRLVVFSNKKTISEIEIEIGLSSILSGELLSNSIKEGQKAVNNFNNSSTKGSRQDKSMIIFPPSLTEKFLRDNVNMFVSKNAPVYLAAVIEYVAAELLEIAASNARGENRRRVTVRDLELSVKLDDELNKLFESQNIFFSEGDDKKNILVKSKFENVVRSICKSDTKISKHVFNILQFFIEQYISLLLTKSNLVANYSGRSKVTSHDILFANNI